MNYYNDIDPFCVQWLKNLMAAGLIMEGDIDERPIQDVQADDVRGYVRQHYFAGLGGWEYALQLAGWLPEWPAWSGSCPCQPLSCAGKRRGENDERHLWPEFYRLISECRPSVIFGEQTASKDGREWLDGISLDLEELGYAVGTADLCAAGTGAPHIRQRLFWVADATGGRATATQQPRFIHGVERSRPVTTDGLGDANEPRRHARAKVGYIRSEAIEPVSPEGGEANRLGNADSDGSPQRSQAAASARHGHPTDPASVIRCRDGKLRRVPDPQSGIFPLAAGIPRKLGPPLTGMGQVGIRAARANRVGRLKGYGNALCIPVAVEFIKAYLETGNGNNKRHHRPNLPNALGAIRTIPRD